jgi:hypothetical protein
MGECGQTLFALIMTVENLPSPLFFKEGKSNPVRRKKFLL